MPVCILVASTKTTHFQQHGLAVCMISNLRDLYSIAVALEHGSTLARCMATAGQPFAPQDNWSA
jgi:hypothetical protein